MLSYDMPGLSFREFLRFDTGKNFERTTLNALLDNPVRLCNAVKAKCHPLEHFKNYLQRLTTLNYFCYLEEAKILHRLFSDLDTMRDLQKPDKILLDNPNLLHILSEKNPETGTVRETFFCNQLRNAGHRVEYGGITTGDFRIDRDIVIEVGGEDKGLDQINPDDRGYVAADGIDSPGFRKIPLWAFGFLY